MADPEYANEVAADYSDCLQIIQERVKPQRETDNREVYRRRWWMYAERRLKLYESIEGMRRVLVRAEVGKYSSFAWRPVGEVFSHMLIVWALEKDRYFALLQSSFHEVWTARYGSSLRTDVRYTPSDCFETFPFPEGLGSLDEIGRLYYEHRGSIMLARQEGLTKTYNRFHDREERSEDIRRLRDLHVEIDNAVGAAYGWNDLDLGHGFHETRQGVRFTVSEECRREVLDRLLALNHERYNEEVAQGLHEKGKKAKKKSTGKRKKKQESDNYCLLF